MPTISLRGRQIAGFWTYPQVDIDDQIKVTLVIRVGMLGEEIRSLEAESISAEMITSEGLTVRPKRLSEGPLDVLGGPGLNVNVEFLFTEAAGNATLLRVSIGNDTVTFPLSETRRPSPDEFTEPPREGESFPPTRGCRTLLDIFRIFHKKCCVRDFQVPLNPNPVNDATKMTEEFDMRADFGDGRTCKCHCCEYRQFVKGQFTRNGAPKVHELAYCPLDTRIFFEDGVADYWGPDRPLRYGHRSDPGDAYDRYLQRRADGCQYRGQDEPGWVRKVAGVAYTVDVEFWGAIIDVCRNRVVRATTWRVQLP